MKILTLLSPSWDGELALLEQRLSLEGIPCEAIRPDELPTVGAAGQQAREKELFILTDHEKIGQKLSRAGIPWAGCGKECWFDGAMLVLESLEGIDGRFLYEWMRRAQNLPAEIAKTKRLTLREMAEADIEDLIRIYRQTDPGTDIPSGRQADPGPDILSGRRADPGLDRSSGRQADLHEHPCADVFTEESLTAYIHTAYRLQGYGLWSVLYGDTLIGCCGFAPCEPDALELQYMLDPAWQRQGFGTEMCRAAIAYARDRLGITDIRVRIDPGNTASLALADKLGLPHTNPPVSPANDS